MRYVISMIVVIMMIGCTRSEVNYMMATGEPPPTFFKITDMKTMNNFVFDTKKFSFLLPQGKVIDFEGDRFWRGASSRDGNAITLFNGPYHIDIAFENYYPQKVTKYERAILDNNLTYIRSHIRIDPDDKLYIRHYGKESYLCTVMEYTKSCKCYKNDKYMGVSCYKFNPSKTEYECVVIRLTYSKPLDPKLARIFTYEDLKKRARRMLDSLYIKSLW